MIIDNLLQRLDYYAKEKGLNDNKITQEAGLSIGLLGNSRKNRGGLNSESIEKILCKYKDLSANWLLTGRGEMLHKTVEGKNDLRFDPPECEKCKMKDEINEALRQQVLVLNKLIRKYEDQERPQEDGQKRKAAS